MRQILGCSVEYRRCDAEAMYEARRIECLAESICYVSLTILHALEGGPDRRQAFLAGFADLAQGFGDATDRCVRGRAN